MTEFADRLRKVPAGRDSVHVHEHRVAWEISSEPIMKPAYVPRAITVSVIEKDRPHYQNPFSYSVTCKARLWQGNELRW
jgi:hypothetical protein